jgi:alkylation response protein AidB-like acyl-CoA dehydrogenase
MAEYRAPVKDFLFAARHIGRIAELAETKRYAHADPESIADVVTELGRFMTEVFGPTNAPGDHEGLQWSPDGVVTPTSFAPAYEKYRAAGWQGLLANPAYGGADFPETVVAAALEFTCAANAALSMLPGLTFGAIECLEVWASEEIKETYLQRLVTGEWSGTMNLTEPQAGSDVGLAATKAVPQPDGTHRITGTKIFISFGEHDLAENIVHLVLARLPDAPPGTKGISLFVVPKFLVNDDGSLGERNDVRCVSIEKKMGIHASPTCVMSYGDEGGAVGYLVGEPNQGMRAMFTMMNSARLAVGAQGLGIGDAAFQKAVEYAQERRQGREVGGAATQPAPIVAHPDVRRMLMFMKSHVEAMRNMVVFNAAAIDRTRALDGDEGERWQEIADLLTPVTKAWCTEVGQQVASTAIQVFGGMGYVEESGVSQHYRDVRIGAIYEGTNGIQAMDLVGRKLPMRMGGVIEDFLALMRTVDAELEAAGDELATIRKHLSGAIDVLAETTHWIMTNGLADPREALAGATPYLQMFGIVAAGWLMAQQAVAATTELAKGASDTAHGDDTAYLEAKVATARYYAEQHLPQARGLVAAVTAGSAGLYAIEVEHLQSV